MDQPADRRDLLRTGAWWGVTAAALPVGALAADTLAGPPAAAAGLGSRPPTPLTTATVVRWTRAYLAAWRDKDADAAAQLFTPDAVYQAVPSVAAQTFQGRDAIRRYWSEVTASQSDLTARHGIPVITGDRAAVELWVTLRATGANPAGDDWITLIEANFLIFARDGRCRRNVEYWNLQLGRLDPPPGWGAGS